MSQATEKTVQAILNANCDETGRLAVGTALWNGSAWVAASSGLGLPGYDYVSLAISPATTETYTFKSGGSGGSTVATVTIVYTDATRGTISSVTKT